MDHWTADVLADLARSLADRGVETVDHPTGRPERFESIALAGLVDRCLRNGFEPGDARLDLSRTNHIPYRRVTQGSGTNQRPDVDELVRWATPLFEVTRGQRTLSFFREGTPFLRSRERPDLLVYDAAFEIEPKSDPFAGEHIVVSWDGDRSGRRRYKRETDSNGPVVTQTRGDPPAPRLGLEVSLNKGCERLREQFGLLRDVGCETIAAVLEHENPCPPGDLPSGATVYTTEDERQFSRSLKQLSERILNGNDYGK